MQQRLSARLICQFLLTSRPLGRQPEYVAETIRIAADAGLVGCNIENAMKDKGP